MPQVCLQEVRVMARVYLITLWAALLAIGGTSWLTACPLEVDNPATVVAEDSPAAIPSSLSVDCPIGNGQVETSERLKEDDDNDGMLWILLPAGGIVVAMIGGRGSKGGPERALPNNGGGNSGNGGGEQNPPMGGDNFPWEPVHTPEPNVAWLLLVTGCLLLVQRRRFGN